MPLGSPVLYRKEIDGLRAVAVLAVMFFHANIPFFSGGFAGVDIFFVISGYLITQIILTQTQNGSFSLVHFYDRRARRILPALFGMMFICLPLAWLILINPSDFKDFCKSVLAIPLFVSNILFWRESGYFDLSTSLKPFLHTWSLAVEEQYYVFFPVYLVILWKFGARLTWWLTIALAVLSLAFAQWSSVHQPIFNFYWLPSRIWELLAGALIPIFYAVFKQAEAAPAPREGFFAEVMGLAGLSLIFSSLVLLDEKILWPSLWTLIPIAGTVLILIFASGRTLAGKLLSVKPMVGVGLISYSAYLWHQPLLAFTKYQFDELTTILKIVLIISALAIGWISWKFLETPFRDKQRFTTRQIFIAALACSVFFVAIGLTGYLKSGFMFRLSSQNEPVVAYTMKTFMQDIRGDKCFIQRHVLSDHYDAQCSDPSRPGGSTLLWGDSHAAALYLGFKNELGDVMQFSAASCPPIFWNNKQHPSCQALNQFAMKQIERVKPRTIYLEANWLAYPGDTVAAGQAIKQIREWVPNVRLILVGNVPHWPKGLPRVVLQSDHSLLKELYVKMPMFAALTASDYQLAAFARQQDIHFVSALDLLCKNDNCLAITETTQGPKLTAFDYGHLTKAGSENLVRALTNKQH